MRERPSTPNSLYARKQRWWAMLVLSLPLFVAFLGCCTPHEEQLTPSPLPPTPSTIPLSSCASRGEHLAWEKLADDSGAPNEYSHKERTPQLQIVTDQGMDAYPQNQLNPSHLNLIKETDFSTWFIAVIYQGRKGSTGYSVEVIDVRREDDTILICALFHEPAPGQVTGQLVTSPYYILKVRKSPELKGDFTFTLVVDGQEVIRQAQAIP